MKLQNHNLLEYINYWGAEEFNKIAHSFDSELLQQLKNNKSIRIIDSPMGSLVVLGSKGRQWLGKSGNYIPDPTSAASNVVRARVCQQLLDDGWTFTKPIIQHRYLVSMQREQNYLLIAARWDDPKTKTVRQWCKLVASILPRPNLLFTARSENPYRYILQENPFASVLILPPPR